MPLAFDSPFASCFDTATGRTPRTLSLSFLDLDDRKAPPPDTVLAQRVLVEEALNEPFRLTVHALTADRWTLPDSPRAIPAHPEAFLGQLARVVIQAEGRQRTFDGIVTACRQLGHWHTADRQQPGRPFQLIELTLEAGLALLRLRRTCRVFQNDCPLSLAARVIREHITRHPAINAVLAPEPDVLQPTHERAYLTQYEESDLDFVHRLLAHTGMNYHLPTCPDRDLGHRVVFVEPQDAPEPGTPPDVILAGDGSRADAPWPHDGRTALPLHHWHARRQLVIARTELHSADYKRYPLRQGADGHDHDRFGADARGEYQPLAPRAYLAPEDHRGFPFGLAQAARHRQTAHDIDAEGFEGETCAPLPLYGVAHVRALDDARQTRRDRGPATADHRAYRLVAQTLVAWATLHPDLRDALDADPGLAERLGGLDLLGPTDDAPRVRARFHALPLEQPLVPPPARLRRPTPGPLTATVVGSEGDVVCTDELGRIGVRLSWQNPHRADRLDLDGIRRHREPITWLRYLHPGAGPRIGFQYLPRVGDEVLVLFLHDDPDRPLAIGSLHHADHRPPAFGGKDNLSPHNAALTGLRTAEHRGPGHNELCLDDTTGELGLHLHTSTAHSTLALGHLATAREQGKATHRGTGAELRTDGAAALRAAQGLLLTTFHTASDAPHLAHDEVTSLLSDCRHLMDRLARAVEAAERNAALLEGADHTQTALRSWAQGSNPAALAVLAAPQPIFTASAQSQLHYAGQHLDLAAAHRVQLHSGDRTVLSATTGIDAYTADGGIHAHARQGDITLRAATDTVRLTAGKDIDLLAPQGTLRLHAQRIEIVSEDGSYLTLADAIQAGTRGDIEMHAKNTRVHGPDTKAIDPLVKQKHDLPSDPTPYRIDPHAMHLRQP